MAKVFVSYSRQSERATRVLIDDLEALGHDIWADHELTGGQAWWDEILARIRACELLAFVLDGHSLKSVACNREYNYAAALGKPILPVLVSDGVSLNALPPVLSQIQYVDYREADRSAGFRLARAVAAIPVPPPLPETLPPPPPIPISYLGAITARLEASDGLSYEDQSALVVDLRRGLRDPETRADAKALLQRLRARRDLFAAIGEEIDEVLAAGGGADGSTVARWAATPAARDPQDTALRSDVGFPSVPSEITSPAERFNGAALLGVLGLVVTGVDLAYVMSGPLGTEASAYLTMYPWYAYPGGGALAGAICGMRRAHLLAAGAGMAAALTTSLVLSANDLVFTVGPLAAVSFPSLGVIVMKTLNP